MKKFLFTIALAALGSAIMAQPRMFQKQKPNVYYTKNITPEALVRMFDVLDMDVNGHVAVKISTGERGNNYYLKPELIRDLVNKVNGVIVETQTLNGNFKQSSQERWSVLSEHGFTKEFAVDVIDEYGQMRIPVKDKKNIKYHCVGDHIANYDYLINLAHFTGNSNGGFSGVLMNASLGTASVNGKGYIQSAGATEDPAIAKKNNTERERFLESVASAAQAVHSYMDGKVLYINVMNNISIDADCVAKAPKPELNDMGIVASLDPVACDQACLDMVLNHKATKGDDEKSLVGLIKGTNGAYITEYAEKIGLGSREYKLVDVDQIVGGLSEAYKDFFDIGVALNMGNLHDPRQTDMVKANYSSVTAENCMKPASLQPKEGEWNWKDADEMADFCRQNGIKMRGHCLCWHSQFADWMFDGPDGKPASKELFYERLEKHIKTVVNRYKDIVYCWDVVNEAMTDDAEAEIPYRQSRHWKLCGDEFIAKCFQWAHEADPKALLMYNDYNAAVPHKRDKIYNMVKKMQDAGVPITGIGMQGHYNIYEPSEADFKAAIEKYSELVKHIHITELDVRVNREMGGQLQFSRTGETVTPMVKMRQERQYSMLFRVMREHKDVIDVVTFWNLSDKDTWLGTANYPLPFDKNLLPKNLYYILRDWEKQPKNPFPWRF
ncbi:MAG: endo-1,4-beta-xylanase [Bacteroidia bacterium]|nr:endo-1,4-beta-xylanase [Bacteroidia bacterium]